MRLYYFTTERYGLEAIRDKRLKIARIAELNDPFDVLGHVIADRKERTRFARWRQQVHLISGMLCMSSSWREPLLWGHYADKHRGICLGFEVTKKWTAVRYVAERTKVAWDEPLTSELADHLVMSKFKAWEYEREYRKLFKLREMSPDPVSDLYFAPFDESMILREVIVGHQCPVTRARLSSVLGEHSTSIEQRKARPAFRTFEVVEQRRKNMWK